jgi:hypothetical protein
MPDEGKLELTEQMRTIFPDERSASRAVDMWMKENQWLPTPADLHKLAKETVNREHVPSNRDCQACFGTGYKQAWELRTYTGEVDHRGIPRFTVELITFEQYIDLRKKVDGHKQNVVAAVDACVCRYGMHLDAARAAERLRREDEAKSR